MSTFVISLTDLLRIFYGYIYTDSKGVKNLICRSVRKSKYLAGNETFIAENILTRACNEHFCNFIVNILQFGTVNNN